MVENVPIVVTVLLLDTHIRRKGKGKKGGPIINRAVLVEFDGISRFKSRRTFGGSLDRAGEGTGGSEADEDLNDVGKLHFSFG